MEKKTNELVEGKNGVSNGVIKHLKMQWPENITVIDLSNRRIVELDENITFPPNLSDLNLSSNYLRKVSKALLNLHKLKNFNLSFNCLERFDDTPNFCRSIVTLNLSNNKLTSPPYWVWTQSPHQLAKLDLSCNTNLTYLFTEEILQYKTQIKDVILYNCGIRKHLELLATFPNARTIEFGILDFRTCMSNVLEHIPCTGLDQCCDIEILNLSNTKIYNIEPKIDMYKNLIEINLSNNNISSLPNRFCNLENLATCILSFNNILYMPEDMVKLKNLVCLRINSNELCMLPEDICSLPKLKILDLYDNSLYEVPVDMRNIEELDLAQNFIEEPDNAEYLQLKQKLRLNIFDRSDGRKIETYPIESAGSTSTSEAEDFYDSDDIDPPVPDCKPDTPEDWDSDEYWIPGFYNRNTPSQAAWDYYVKNKIQEGNFCPIDLHTYSVMETVRKEKLSNPKPWTVVDGQFDDYSEDES